ncbi:hypothetical protein SAMN04487785_11415 [Dyella jiangningensis]|uniref:HNH endonuclease n=1 Tax=Dyella sp. AtDHG13 TaxID=1938897 RepID=UPI000886FAD8|nr:HNH endonuclease signature motif containing protein [Dyella sp. AtDHG13]PXV54205.1 hypothetical protein BDW41_113158 [Dyella sp. AtDHG13]SDL04109.1 hypothetical protein SAMN04487785_11415 [Dyella jiangningensis]
MAKTYWEKLKDPRWQKKRLEALQSAEFACQVCYDSESTLHVHHKQYFKGREPWEYEVEQLAVLCEACHAEHHASDDELSVVCSFLPMDSPRSRSTVASLIAGYAGQELPSADPDHFAYYAGILAERMFANYSSNIYDLLDMEVVSRADAYGIFHAALAYVKSKRGDAT